jgi:hypothetical protein
MLWMYVLSVLFAAALVAIRQAMVSHKATNSKAYDACWDNVDVTDNLDEAPEERQH